MSLGHFFGGVAQGIGAGLVRQGEMNQRSQEAEAGRRHDIALQELRHNQSNEQMQKQYDYQDRNASRDDERGDLYDARRTARQTNATITIHNNQATNDATRDTRQFNQQVQLRQVDAANAQQMARLQANLANQSAAFKQSLDAGEVAETLVGSDGNYYFRTRGGEIRNTNIQAAPREVNGGSGGGIGSGILANRGAGAAAPPSGVRPVQAAPQRGTVEGGYRFNGGDPANPNNWTRVQ